MNTANAGPLSGMPSSGTMVVRVSPDDVIIYANQALTTYLGVDREKILGTSLESLRNYAKGEIAFCFERPEKAALPIASLPIPKVVSSN